MRDFDVLKNKYDVAVSRRDALCNGYYRNIDAYRLVHSDADDLPGITVDRFGPALLVETHIRGLEADGILAVLRARHGDDAPIFLRERRSPSESARNGLQVSGTPYSADLVVREGDLSFEVHLKGHFHVGVFLDSRAVRRLVQKCSKGKRMLNLFAYTGGFGMAAAAGGARSTTNLDMKRSALKTALCNYQRSGLPFDSRTFLKSDSTSFLKKSYRNKHFYDIVVLDPPPVSKRTNRDILDTDRGFTKLVIQSLGAVSENGMMVVGLNNQHVSNRAFDEMISEGLVAANRVTTECKRIKTDIDFPLGSARPTARFVVLEGIRKLSRNR